MTRLGCPALALALLLASPALSATEKLRLTWRDDPSTTMVVGWVQASGNDAIVHYDTVDHGPDWAAYTFTRAHDRALRSHGMQQRFARLTGLEPDTAYYFVLVDDEGVSERSWFKTAPADCAEFTVVAGGDSRNNRTSRRNGNTLVAKLRPLFVYFGGDYVFDGGDAGEISDWLDDWQSTRSLDGRVYPILATRGNHETDGDVEDLFDSPNPDIYFALSFGGTLLRTYTLNSEIVEGGDQADWLADDLTNVGSQHVFKMAQYHKPMRPHTTGKSEGVDEYDAWAQLFHDHRVDLVVECDSHLVKRTWPIRPANGGGSDEGFIRDDAEGTVYVGEGGWGAPLRNANDAKNWTRAMGSMNQVQWIHVQPHQMTVRTVRTSNAGAVGEVDDSDPLALPAGLDVWAPGGDDVIVLPSRATGLPDSDGDTVPDECDACPQDNPDDSDADGICDSEDACPGSDDLLDMDLDGVPDGCDDCPLDNPDDTDSDGVCESDDVCPGFDDTLDRDGDGTPDDCDACPDDNPNDSDGDGVCESVDACPGFDDALDADGDGIADGCDACPGSNDAVDTDGDGVPDGCDPCPLDDPDDTDADGTCDSDDLCPDFDDAVGAPATGPGASVRQLGAALRWSDVGNATGYPVHRGTIPRAGGMASRAQPHDHACVVESATTSWADPDEPTAEVGYYYLVGARNPCGDAASPLGLDSLAQERPSPPSCP